LERGTFEVDNSGNVKFTPFLNSAQTSSIQYTVKDMTGEVSNTATITVNITAQNDPPVIDPIPPVLEEILEDTYLRVCRLAADPEGDPITFTIENVKGGGTMPPDDDPDFSDFCYKFLPILNYNGESVWRLTACDNNGACSSVEFTIPIKPVNDKPVAKNDTIIIAANKTVTVNVIENDLPIVAPYAEFYDVHLEAGLKDSVLIFDIIKEPTVGKAGYYVRADKKVIEYTPDPNYLGVDSIVYRIYDHGTPTLYDTAMLYIIIERKYDFMIYEGISPGASTGKNDVWRIEGIERFPNNQVMIFDRYNNLVWETKGYDNEINNWKGQANRGMGASSLSEGTYYFILNLGSGERTYSGYVILKRN
jgi:gliding motility-associated-like protein